MKKKNEFHLKNLFDDQRFIMVLSLVLAALVWLAVVTVIDSTGSTSISVPVDLTYNASAYKSMGLDIIDKPAKNISVRVEGDSTVLGNLGAEDFIVTPDYTSVTGPGEYRLKLDIKKANTFTQCTITGPAEQYITVTFDKLVTQKFAVTVNASGVQPAGGYYMDIPTSAPKEVSVTGPEVEVLRIDKVMANVQLNEERSESAIANANLTFVDKDGNPVESTYLTCDTDQVEVTIPIYKVKELPLTLGYVNVPAGFDVNQLKPSLSQGTIRIAGPAEQVDKLESLEAGIINLAMFKLGEPVALTLTMPDGLRNIDSLQAVTVTFDTSGYTTKTVTVQDIRAINVPSGMTITFPTARINNVTLVGTEEELENLTDADVVAQVNASSNDVSVVKGQQNLKAQIVVPSTQTVFATGSYTILCEIKTEG